MQDSDIRERIFSLSDNNNNIYKDSERLDRHFDTRSSLEHVNSLSFSLSTIFHILYIMHIHKYTLLLLLLLLSHREGDVGREGGGSERYYTYYTYIASTGLCMISEVVGV